MLLKFTFQIGNRHKAKKSGEKRKMKRHGDFEIDLKYKVG